jgi:hypothetical protein
VLEWGHVARLAIGVLRYGKGSPALATLPLVVLMWWLQAAMATVEGLVAGAASRSEALFCGLGNGRFR